MAAPNIVNISAMYGKTAFLSPSTTSATALLSNAASSNTVLKINSLTVANVNGTNSTAVSVNIYSAAALGGTAYAVASTITVPADATLVVIDKNTPIYLEENRSIGVTALTANDLQIVCSYEEIS
jgi:hypothetical protein